MRAPSISGIGVELFPRRMNEDDVRIVSETHEVALLHRAYGVVRIGIAPGHKVPVGIDSRGSIGEGSPLMRIT